MCFFNWTVFLSFLQTGIRNCFKFVFNLENEPLTADFILSQGESCRAGLPEPLSQQEPIKGTAAELLSWQVSPSSERIAGIKLPLVLWSLVSMVLMSGAWVGSGCGSGGF